MWTACGADWAGKQVNSAEIGGCERVNACKQTAASLDEGATMEGRL
jgi:hypothetical protein